MSEPTIKEIMEFHRLGMTFVSSSRTLTEDESELFLNLAEKLLPYDLHEIMFSKIEELERKLDEQGIEIKKLDADYQELQRLFIRHSQEYQASIKELERKLEVAREALQFYDEPKTYWMRYDSGDGFVNKSDIDNDLGHRARQALKEIE